MDYETKPTCRKDIRKIASIMRAVFEVCPTGRFPVLEILDKIPDVFRGSNYVIVDDHELPSKIMAQCTPNDAGGFTIEIKKTVYMGAYEKHIGAFLGFICHEICHLFLFYIGFTPIYARSFEEGTIPAYRSVEWQAKALCGEVMIPFDESRGMTAKELQQTYQVSESFAKYRIKESSKKRRNVH